MQFRKLPFIFVVAGVARFAAAETVWIDTDISIGSPIREVDDAYAIVLALHSPEIRIAGISTSYGNAALGHTTRAARELIRQFGAPANVKPDQVFAGARNPADLGRRSEASEALARLLEKNSVTYLALGPLTNLATFLQLHPESARKIRRVIFLGGQIEGTTLSFGPNASFHVHDANVYKDPRAAAVVLGSNIPIGLVPVATGSQLALNEDDLRVLDEQGGASRYLSRRSRVWLWFWTHVVRTNGGPIFDAVAVVAATRPGLVFRETRYAKMDEMGNLWVTRRQSAAATATTGLTNGGRPVRCCTHFVAPTKRLVIQRLESRPGRE
jgi:inosine-uridine nucleoside N-ribohydrolase